MDWLVRKLDLLFEWLIDQLKELGAWFLDAVLSGLLALVDLIPLPDWLVNADLTIPDEVYYWIEPFQIGLGATILVSAYVTRFFIRRLPIVG